MDPRIVKQLEGFPICKYFPLSPTEPKLTAVGCPVEDREAMTVTNRPQVAPEFVPVTKYENIKFFYLMISLFVSLLNSFEIKMISV